jgi:DNA polymerase III gamma/tau subunit
MAYLIIETNNKYQVSKVLKLSSEISGKTFETIEQLQKHPEVILKGLKKEDKLGIEDIKDLQTAMTYRPMELSKQIAIIFNCQKMTVEAQNAMLKTLEDYSDWSEYILVVDNDQNLLNTIISRCKKLYTHDNSSTEKPDTISSDTNIQDLLSESISNQFLFIEKLVEEEKETPDKIINFISNISNYLQQSLQSAINTKDKSKEEESIYAIEKVNIAKRRIEANTNKKLTLENLLLQLKRV